MEAFSENDLCLEVGEAFSQTVLARLESTLRHSITKVLLLKYLLKD
jgi:hypothetical protein